MRVAKALGYINEPSVVEFLTGALKDKKLDIIAGAYYFFIHRGEEGTEAILIEALNKYGDDRYGRGLPKLWKWSIEQSSTYMGNRSWLYYNSMADWWQWPVMGCK